MHYYPKIQFQEWLKQASTNGFIEPKVIKGQTFKVGRTTIDRKTGKQSQVVGYGITCKTPELNTAKQVLRDNRLHWAIENICHNIPDWNFNGDLFRILKGYEPGKHVTTEAIRHRYPQKEGYSQCSSKKCDSSVFSPRMVLII